MDRRALENTMRQPERTSSIVSTADALIALGKTRARTLGLEIVQESDFHAWARELAAAPGITAVSKAFNPDYCDLTNALWLRLHDGRQLLGTIAGKRLTGDFLALQRSGALWFGRRSNEFEPLALEFPPSVPDIKGRLGYFGALWLHPQTRGTGLAGIMARMMRAVAMREWDLDWLCGGVLEALARAQVPTRVYGYAHCVRISGKIRFPVTGTDEVLYMPWESRNEWLASSRLFVAERDATVAARQ